MSKSNVLSGKGLSVKEENVSKLQWEEFLWDLLVCMRRTLNNKKTKNILGWTVFGRMRNWYLFYLFSFSKFIWNLMSGWQSLIIFQKILKWMKLLIFFSVHLSILSGIRYVNMESKAIKMHYICWPLHSGSIFVFHFYKYLCFISTIIWVPLSQ